MPNLLNEKLRKLRLEKNYTQDYVAKYLNMTRQGYAHYEAGLRSPDHQTLLKLSNLYHIDIGDLINNFTTPIDTNMLQENPPYHTSVKTELPTNKKTIQLTYDERRLFNLFQKLTSSEKKELLAFLEEKTKTKKISPKT
jgi:transcriptional regulator with XRE-family HTH domain